jgi:hypothetical protein
MALNNYLTFQVETSCNLKTYRPSDSYLLGNAVWTAEISRQLFAQYQGTVCTSKFFQSFVTTHMAVRNLHFLVSAGVLISP